jgi:hypothetical protein
MKSLSVTVKIWAKTVALNAFLWGAACMLKGDIWEALGSILFLLGGFIVTLPFLMLIFPLVNVSTLLPYSIPAKTVWLTFYLIGLIILFYGLFSLVKSDTFFKSYSWTGQFMGTSIGGLLIAVITSRKSLNKLYTAV